MAKSTILNIKGVTVTVIEVNEPSDAAAKDFNKLINEIARERLQNKAA